MVSYIMTEAENLLAELIWEREPLGSGELVKLASQRLGWKKSTTYTVLRKICENDIFQNKGAVVTSKISREGPWFLSLAKFSCTKGFSHMFVFIAGASKIGLEKAQAVDNRRLSQIPFAILEIVFALAGAITKISDSHNEMCSGLYSSISKLST